MTNPDDRTHGRIAHDDLDAERDWHPGLGVAADTSVPTIDEAATDCYEDDCARELTIPLTAQVKAGDRDGCNCEQQTSP